MSTLTPAQMSRIAELATADQRAAAEHDFERRAARAAAAFLAVSALLAVYAVLALAGLVPAMPWSPVGSA